MSSKRRFQNLTIRDNFLFAAVMMYRDNCKKFLEMVLGIQIKEIVVSYEKSLIYNPECKGVRLDVYANDENNTRYDIEMQVAEQELGKRTRYYHSQMDMDLLDSGHEYEELPKAYVIFICDYDPFKKGKYCYIFENRCVDDISINMGDESISIFLSTAGKDKENISTELLAFLEFVKGDNPGNNTETKDAYVKELQESIRSLKEDRKLERGFMTWEDVRKEARKEGKRESIFNRLRKLGEISEEIQRRVMSESRAVVLESMLEAAYISTSMEEFQEKVSKL